MLWGRSDALSFDVLHNMKGKLYNALSNIQWVKEQGIKQCKRTENTNDIVSKVDNKLRAAWDSILHASGLTNRLVEFSRNLEKADNYRIRQYLKK